MNKIQKQEALRLADQIFSRLCPVAVNQRRACLHHAIAIQLTLSSMGHRAILQAGSASFLFDSSAVEPEPSHYSYVYSSLNLGALIGLAQGLLPEMHCWVVAEFEPEEWTVIDPTTHHLIELTQAKGFEWKEPAPPDCLWHHINDIPLGWVYEASQEATSLAHSLARELIELCLRIPNSDN